MLIPVKDWARSEAIVGNFASPGESPLGTPNEAPVEKSLCSIPFVSTYHRQAVTSKH